MTYMNIFSDLSSIFSSDKSFCDINILEDSIFFMHKESKSDFFEYEQTNNIKMKIFDIVKEKKNCKIKQNIDSNWKATENHKNQIKDFYNKEKNCNKFSSTLLYDSKRPFFCIDKNNANAATDITNQNKDNDFLGKKRDLFKIESHKDFSIFNYGDYNIDIRKMIQEILDNSNKVNYMVDAKSEKRKKTKIKIKDVHTRKENADNIRKKIKLRFLKHLRNVVNERLTAAGAKKKFKFLAQKFTSDITRQKNKAVLNLSFKEIFSKNFWEGFTLNEENNSDLLNYYHNLSVLEYLEKNKEISEKSNFNKFKDMKFYQIFKEYLKSREFEMEIASLKGEKENDKYIKNYIIKARDLIDFFAN